LDNTESFIHVEIDKVVYRQKNTVNENCERSNHHMGSSIARSLENAVAVTH